MPIVSLPEFRLNILKNIVKYFYSSIGYTKTSFSYFGDKSDLDCLFEEKYIKIKSHNSNYFYLVDSYGKLYDNKYNCLFENYENDYKKLAYILHILLGCRSFKSLSLDDYIGSHERNITSSEIKIDKLNGILLELDTMKKGIIQESAFYFIDVFDQYFNFPIWKSNESLKSNLFLNFDCSSYYYNHNKKIYPKDVLISY